MGAKEAVETPSPETPVKDGSAAPGAAVVPPAQDKPWWEMRGFKSELEAVESLDQGQKTISELRDQSAQKDRVLNGLMAARGGETAPATPAAPAAQPGYRAYMEGLDFQAAYADPNQFATALLTAADRLARARAQATFEQQSALADIRRDFYEKNPDLKPFHEIVRVKSDEVLRANPNATMSEAMKEVARLTRKTITEIRAGQHAPVAPVAETPGALPHVGPGSSEAAKGGDSAAPVKAPVTTLSDAESFARERVEAQQKKMPR